MPINSLHPDYQRFIDKWSRCRDVYEGEDEVKRKGTKYLPMLSGQQPADYEAYAMRAVFYNAFARTVDALVGAVLRIPPEITVPDKMLPLLDNITATGEPFIDFVKTVLREVLLTNRFGILVDRDADESDSPPYLVGYTAEQITNWWWDTSHVVLREEMLQANFIDPDNVTDGVAAHATNPNNAPGDQVNGNREPDPYVYFQIVQYRELLRNPDGTYQINLYRANANANVAEVPMKVAKEYAVFQTFNPTARGVPLKELPFIFCNAVDMTTKVYKPPLLDLVNVNLSHYRTSADLEHGRHFTALPTPWVSGVPTDSAPLTIGSGTAWVLPDPQARAGYLEFVGQGLNTLKDALSEKEAQMAVLGARLLEGPKSGVEASDTVRMRQLGDVFTLANVADSVSRSLTTALKVYADWEGIESKDIKVKLSTDYVETQLDGRALLALVQAWQVGGISQESLIWNMKQAELLPPGTTVEDEIDKIEVEREKNPPIMQQLSVNPQAKTQPNGQKGSPNTSKGAAPLNPGGAK